MVMRLRHPDMFTLFALKVTFPVVVVVVVKLTARLKVSEFVETDIELVVVAAAKVIVV